VDRLFRKKWHVIVIFVVLAFLSVAPQLLKQVLWINAWDVPFHLSRMFELEKGFELGKWLPDISAYTFGSNGYGVNLFYGYSYTYFTAVLYYITHHAVTSILVSYIIMLTGAMLINFYAAKLYFDGKFNANKAALFSIIYVLAPTTFGELISRGLPGEIIGILLFPALLSGTYGIMFKNQKHWIFTGIIGALIVTNHVLSSVLAVLVLLVMFIYALFRRFVTKSVLSNLVKTAGLVVLLSAFYIVPFVEQMVSTKIARPNVQVVTIDVFNSIVLSLTNVARVNWQYISVGLFVFVMVIFVAVLGMRKDGYTKSVQVTGGLLVISVLVVMYAPTGLLIHTPFKLFQTMGRFYPIVMTLAVLFVVQGMFELYEKQLLSRKNMQAISAIGVVLAMFGAWNLQASAYYDNSGDFGVHDYRIKSISLPDTVNDDSFVNEITGEYRLPIGSKDYQGQDRVHITTLNYGDFWGDEKDATQVLVDGRVSKLHLTHNGYTFKVNKIPTDAREISLPMTAYKGWQIVDATGKQIPYYDKVGRMTVRVKNVTSLTITYHKTKLSIIAWGVSILTVVALLVIAILFRKWLR